MILELTASRYADIIGIVQLAKTWSNWIGLGFLFGMKDWIVPNRFQIDPANEVPAYRQLIQQVAALVRTGQLKAGDRLPAARDLSVALGVARGTVAKAYEELARCGVLEVTPGRGSFISAQQDVVPLSRMERGVQWINEAIDQLTSLSFSPREIRNMVELVLMEREEQSANLHIAIIDCSPEALTLLQRQLSLVLRLDIKTILLDELSAGPQSQRRLSEFDLLITTARHFSETLALVPSLRDKIVQVIVTSGHDTIVNLAGLKPQQSVGIVCESEKFRAIILKMLSELGITNSLASLIGSLEDESLRLCRGQGRAHCATRVRGDVKPTAGPGDSAIQ